jgi:hypothetical protein
VTLRNFGLSFSRQDARPDAGVSWRQHHTVGAGIIAVLVLILIAWTKMF